MTPSAPDPAQSLDPLLRFGGVSATFSPVSPKGARRTVACDEPPGADHNDRMNVEMAMTYSTERRDARKTLFRDGPQKPSYPSPEPDQWKPIGEPAADVLRRLRERMAARSKGVTPP